MTDHEIVPSLSDPLAALDEAADAEGLTQEEAGFVRAARAANTVRGYRSDWAEFDRWCTGNGQRSFPATAVAISRYLTYLAGLGASVGTMSRRLSAIRYAHHLRSLPDPTKAARVVTVWEGIRRTHGAPPVQATPLMPPLLWDVLSAIPRTKAWKDPRRPPEASLAGIRDRALLLVGFVSGMRRSELSAMDVEWIEDDPKGVVIAVPRSKTNQRGDHTELVVLPQFQVADHCPVRALRAWIAAADITGGAVFRRVSKGNRALQQRLAPGSINQIVQAHVQAAGVDPATYSAHSLRAGFVTYASTVLHLSDHAIAHQTRHRSLDSVSVYRRVEDAWTDNAATQLGW